MRLDKSVLGIWKALGTLVMLVIFVGAAFGQSATGTLTGTVTDAQGAAMVGVIVTVRNADTAVDQRPVMTNNTGVYLLPLLPPATYDISVSQKGFATVQRKGVVLQVGSTMRVDFEMPVAAQESLVTVTTEIPILETEKTEQAQSVNENLVSNLPVSSRRWEQFALLTPGVNPDGVSGGMSFHGINNLYNNNSVDGANNNYNYDGGSRGGPNNDGYVYSGDSIREFQVSSSGFGAEVGQSAGGSVNAVTKSGTNQLHGDAFYNGRAANFNAIDPVNQDNVDARNAAKNSFIPGSGTELATQNIHQQHQYGVSVGGPLIKDKLFFFTTLDAYRKVNPLLVSTNQLNPSIQSLTCPTLTSAGVTAGATVPTAVQCQAAKDYVFAHFIGQFPRTLRQDVELLKLDYQLNQANHLNGVANIRDWKQPTPDGYLQLAASSAAPYRQSRFIIANWTTVIGNNKVNEARFQWGKDNSFTAVKNDTGMPGVSLSNLFSYGAAFGGSGWNTEYRKQISDNFSFSKGTHAFKTGMDINLISDDIRSSSSSGGSYSYSGAVALGANVSCTAPTGFSSAQTANTIFCDWLMDLYGKDSLDGRARQHFGSYAQFGDNIESGNIDTFRYIFPNNDYAFYFQDTWKMRPNVTLNWGLRYDLQAFTELPNSVLKVFGAAHDLPIFDQYTTTYPNEYDAIQPRIGMAWNIKKETVIRWGGGVFFAKSEGHNVKNVVSGAGETQYACRPPNSASTCAGPLSFPNVYFYQNNEPLFTPVLLGAVTPTTQPPGAFVVPNPQFGIRSVDPNLRRPRVYSLQGGIEQQLPGRMNLSVSYVFSRGIGLPRGRDFNLGPNHFDATYCSTAGGGSTPQVCGLSVTKTFDVVDSAGVTQTAITLPFYSQRVTSTGAFVLNPATGLPVFSSRVDPRTGLMDGNDSSVDTRYNGLIVSLRKPMSHGVEVLANYTLSKSTDNGEEGGGLSGEGQVAQMSVDPFNNRLEEGATGTDVRNRFTTSVIWAPGFERNTTGVMRQLIGGWSLASTIVAQNGSPTAANVQGTNPNQSYSGFLAGATTATTFIYSPINAGLAGSGGARVAWVPKGSYRLPNLYNVDVRLSKQFIINERYHIEFRGEAFNLFNSTMVLAVGTNAYSYASPSGTSTTCPNSVSAGNGGNVTPHTNTCMVPVTTFGQRTTTTGNLLGARQMQAGFRFEF